MPRSILLWLTDIREAIQGITALTADGSYEAFVRDWGKQRAVERGLEIISEASRHIPDDRKTSAPNIPGGKSLLSAIYCAMSTNAPTACWSGTSSLNTCRTWQRRWTK
jgi:hypothetical protein